MEKQARLKKKVWLYEYILGTVETATWRENDLSDKIYEIVLCFLPRVRSVGQYHACVCLLLMKLRLRHLLYPTMQSSGTVKAVVTTTAKNSSFL